MFSILGLNNRQCVTYREKDSEKQKFEKCIGKATFSIDLKYGFTSDNTKQRTKVVDITHDTDARIYVGMDGTHLKENKCQMQ